MSMRVLKTCVLTLAIAAPAAAMAQDRAPGGALAGAATGAAGGAIVGGPVGAVVGGAAGAVVGATVGGLSSNDRVYVKHYVVEKQYPSMRMDEPVAVGEMMPAQVTYYQIEDRPELRRYRYAYVNDQVVVVEPRTRKVVEVIN